MSASAQYVIFCSFPSPHSPHYVPCSNFFYKISYVTGLCLILLQIAQFDFGVKSENPLKELYVYTKQEPNKAVRFNRDMVLSIIDLILLQPLVLPQSVIIYDYS